MGRHTNRKTQRKGREKASLSAIADYAYITSLNDSLSFDERVAEFEMVFGKIRRT